MSLTHTVGYDGIVWTRIVSGKLTAKHTNDIELPDVRTSVRQFAAQQSTLRLKQPDYALAEEEARDDANAAATAAAATADDDATDASSNPKKRKRPASAGIVSSAIASTSAATASDSSFSFLQKTRLHLIIDDASQLHSLNPHNPVLQSYDIISVVAATEKLFHACCGHESVDIITIESARKMHFYLKKPAMNVALERGIYFEFNFAPALRDPTTRRYLFSNLQSFVRVSRGRNLVLSSGASKEIELRAPWDVINIAVICGLDPAAAKATIAASARSVLLHAHARKTVKCVLREVPSGEVTMPITSSISDSAASAPAGAAPHSANDDKQPHSQQAKKRAKTGHV